VLEELVAGRRPNVIRVPENVAAEARVALDRMLAAKPQAA
jgi:quinolinate synthase